MAEPIERVIEIDTDVHALMLHHPDPLREFEGWSPGWYDAGYGHEPVARDGRLVVWGTGGNGSYRVRLVVVPDDVDPLTEEERARLVATHEGRCDASLGALYLDNAEGLPSRGRRDDVDAMAERCLDLPPGRYRVRVHALDDGADEDNQDGTWDGPTFTVVLSPVDESGWGAIDTPTFMPDLTPWPIDMRDDGFADEATLRAVRETMGRRSLLPHVPDVMPSWDRVCELLDDGFLTAGPARGRYPLVPAPGFAVLPGEHRMVETTDEWMSWTWNAGLGGSVPKFLHEYAFAAPELKDGAPAVLCRIVGATRGQADGKGRLSLRGLAPVRLQYPEVHVVAMRHQLPQVLGREPVEADWWGVEHPMIVSAHPLPAPGTGSGRASKPALPDGVAARLRTSVDAILDVDERIPVLAVRPDSHAEERHRIAWVDPTAEALIDWLLHRLDLSGALRLRLWDAPYAERLAGMEEAIAAAEAGWTVRGPVKGSA